MKIERNQFLKVLESAQPALSTKRNDKQELHCFWFDGQFVYAYNGSVGIRATWKNDLKGGLIGRVLLGLLQSTETKEISILRRKNGIEFQFEHEFGFGHGKYTLSLFDIKQSPWPLKTMGSSQTILSVTKELAKAFKYLRLIKVKKPFRAEHYGVVAYGDGETVELYTANSRALVMVPIKAKFSGRVVLPHGFFKEVIQRAKVGTEIVFTDEGAIVADLGDMLLLSRQQTGSDLFDLPALLDKRITSKEQYVPVPKSLKEVLNQASSLAGSDFAYVTLSLSGKELRIEEEFRDGRRLEEAFPLTERVVKAARIQVALDPLKDLIEHTKEFAITKKALVMLAGNGAVFLVAAHYSD